MDNQRILDAIHDRWLNPPEPQEEREYEQEYEHEEG